MIKSSVRWPNYTHSGSGDYNYRSFYFEDFMVWSIGTLKPFCYISPVCAALLNSFTSLTISAIFIIFEQLYRCAFGPYNYHWIALSLSKDGEGLPTIKASRRGSPACSPVKELIYLTFFVVKQDSWTFSILRMLFIKRDNQWTHI
jgi:hypothetical protein